MDFTPTAEHKALRDAVRDLLGRRTPSTAVGQPRLDADQLHIPVRDEGIEHACRVAPAADTGHDNLGQSAQFLARLRDRLAADDRLKIADHSRKRVRADDRADDVVCCLD